MQRKKSSSELMNAIIEGIEETKGENTRILDLRDLENSVAKYFVICDANSNTQVNAIARNIQKQTSKTLKEKPWHVEGTENAHWILMDYIDIVVHVFQKSYREFYDIEGLWGDAKEMKTSNFTV